MKIKIEIEEQILLSLKQCYTRSLRVCDPLTYECRQRDLLQALADTLLSVLPDPEAEEDE